MEKWITGKEKVQVEKDCKVTDITLNHKKVPMTFFLGDVGEVKIYMTPSEVRHLLVRLMIDAMWESPEGN
jgi:hypothetical protein